LSSAELRMYVLTLAELLDYGARCVGLKKRDLSVVSREYYE